MEDKLLDVSAVLSALEDYKSEVTKLGKKLNTGDGTLESNKNEINTAWMSENATSFVGSYANLITYLTEAYNSLFKYQEKIQNVVNEFQGFDTTIEKAE